MNNKIYFTKYISVEGEIKEGDLRIDKWGVICPFDYSTAYDKLDELQKVKLFLCSRDIQVGDKIMTLATGNDFILRNRKDIENVEHHYAKVIGEVLTPGIKEGQEFTEKEIEYLTIKDVK